MRLLPPLGGRLGGGQHAANGVHLSRPCGSRRTPTGCKKVLPGRAQPSHTLPRVGAWGNPGSPYPCGAGAWGNPVSPHPSSTIVDCRFWIVDCPAGRHRAIRHSDQCGKFNRKWYSRAQVHVRRGAPREPPGGRSRGRRRRGRETPPLRRPASRQGVRPSTPSRGWGHGETRFPHTPLREPRFTSGSSLHV